MAEDSRSWLDRLLRRPDDRALSDASPCDDPALRKAFGCDEVQESASDLIDGDTSPSLTDRVKEHLGLCDDCDGWVKTFAETVGLIRTLPQEEVPDSLKEKIRNISNGGPA